MNSKQYILDTTKTLFQTLVNMGVTYEEEDLTFDIVENHITEVVKNLTLSGVSDSLNYKNGVKEFGLKVTYSEETDGRKFLEVFANNGEIKFQEWCKYKDGSFNYR